MLLWNLIFSQLFPDQLVKYGLFRRIEVCRLPVGHTHEDIDALFDVLRRESRHKTLITPQDWKDMAIAAFSLDFVSVAWNRPSASVGANLSKSFWQKCKSVFLEINQECNINLWIVMFKHHLSDWAREVLCYTTHKSPAKLQNKVQGSAEAKAKSTRANITCIEVATSPESANFT